jgi:hypothetical protein
VQLRNDIDRISRYANTNGTRHKLGVRVPLNDTETINDNEIITSGLSTGNTQRTMIRWADPEPFDGSQDYEGWKMDMQVLLAANLRNRGARNDDEDLMYIMSRLKGAPKKTHGQWLLQGTKHSFSRLKEAWEALDLQYGVSNEDKTWEAEQKLEKMEMNNRESVREFANRFLALTAILHQKSEAAKATDFERKLLQFIRVKMPATRRYLTVNEVVRDALTIETKWSIPEPTNKQGSKTQNRGNNGTTDGKRRR